MRIVTLVTLLFYSLNLLSPWPLQASEEGVRLLKQDLDEHNSKLEALEGEIAPLAEELSAWRIELEDLDRQKEEIAQRAQESEARTTADLRALYRKKSSSEDTMYTLANELDEINNYEQKLNDQFHVRHEINEATYQSLLADHRASANSMYGELLKAKRRYEEKVAQLDQEIQRKTKNAEAYSADWARQILEIQTEKYHKEQNVWKREDVLEKLYDQKNMHLKEIALIYEHLAEEAPEIPPYLVSVLVRMEGRSIYGAHWEERTEEEEKDERDIKQLTKLAEEAMAAYESMKGFEEPIRQLRQEAERNSKEADAKVASAESKKFYAGLAGDVVLIVATAGVMGAISKTGTFATHLMSETMSYGFGKGVQKADDMATSYAYKTFGSEWKKSEGVDLEQRLFRHVRDRWRRSYSFHELMNHALRDMRFDLPAFDHFKKPSLLTLANEATISSRALVSELRKQSQKIKSWGGTVKKKEVITAVAGLGKDFIISYFFDGEIAEWKQKYLEAEAQIAYYDEYWVVQNAAFRCAYESAGFFYKQLFDKKKEVEPREDKREFFRDFSPSMTVKKDDRFEITLTFSIAVKPPTVTVGGKSVPIDGSGPQTTWKGTFAGAGLDKAGKGSKTVPISVSAADTYDRQLDANPETVPYHDPPWENRWNGYEPGPDMFHRLALKGASGEGAVLFVIDVSGSMEGSPLESAKRAVKSAVEGMEEKSEVAIMSFAGCGGVSVLSGFTSDKSSAASAVDGLSAAGATPYSKAIAAGRQFLNAQSTMEPKRMVILSDGMETCQGNPNTAGVSSAPSSGGAWVESR